MSWSKFNDSLNSLKGQITTFIEEHVVPEEEDEEPVPDKEVQLEQLQGVLSAQENEVSLHGSGRVVQQGHVLEMCCRYCKEPFY